MRGFFKIFFASLLAICVFFVILILMGVGIFNTATSDDKPVVKAKTVLVLDISKPIMEQKIESGFSFPEGPTKEVVGLYDLIKAIESAAADSAVKGIYLVGSSNPNGFATSEELRDGLERFKKSGKFILAYSNYFNQRAYELANVAQRIYINPAGGLDWQGYSFQLGFYKDLLDKLEIKPEIFYAGQFKSATEPFRYNKMSDANRLQMKSFIEDLYQHFLLQTAAARNVDTAKLRQMATDLSLGEASDAVAANLANKALYDDEVKEMIVKKIGAESIEKINFMPFVEYIKAERGTQKIAKEKVAIIYAQGEIVDGKGEDGQIGGEKFRQLIRKARLDDDVKAVVLRVNSPGGSSLASEVMFRELTLLQKEKPLVVSMGDYAASGGYYISCGADSIFAQSNTLTGSIGVFSLLFDVSKLMSHKLGITFDEVNTSPSATLGSPFRPMTDLERKYLQRSVDSTYALFKRRVSQGRKLSLANVDSIGQGRIWSGKAALKNGLIDRIGTIDDAVACAARLAKLKTYSIKEWPIVEPFWEKLFGEKSDPQMQIAFQVKQQMGSEFYTAWRQIQQMKSWVGKPQMRLPFFVMPSE